MKISIDIIHYIWTKSAEQAANGPIRMLQVQGWAKEWALGCANPASWLSPAAGGEFTQPRAHSFAHLCSLRVI